MSEEKRNHFISLLDDYLDGKLESAKAAEIKKAIEEDDSFKELLAQQVDARANIRLAGEAELKNKFTNSFETTDTTPEPIQPKSNWIKILLPLLMLLGLAAGAYYFLMQKNSNPPAKEIYATTENSENELLLMNVEDPSYDLLRTTSNNAIANQWDNSVKLFFEKDYQQALASLITVGAQQQFIETHPGKYALMKGVCHLKLQQFEEAEKSFAMIPNTNPYFDQAEWYQALTYYYNGEAKTAGTALTKIKDDSSHYKKAQAEIYLSTLSLK